MIVKILGNKDTAAYQAARSLVMEHGHKLCNENNCRLFEIKHDYKQEDLDLLYNSIKNIIDYED